MADIVTSAAPSRSTEPGRGGNSRGRGRGRGHARGNSQGDVTATREEDGSRGNRGGRGRGRARGHQGRGGRGGGRPPAGPVTAAGQEPTLTQPPPQPGGHGVFGARLTKDAENKSLGENTGAAPSDEVEAEVCFICASPISHQSVAPCNHRTCHICALRLRALYKTKACAHCRTESPLVIFTDDGDKRYEDFTPSDFYRTDENLGICYEKPEIFEDTVLLLRYNCPDESCDVACMGWPDLHRHVRSVHQKMMCDLCTRNKKVFTHEHELFTHAELKKHEKYGDDTPGAADQSGFQGHPECGFCRQRFYGDDELFAHCRDRHERCHLCDRRTGGNKPQYYLDYNALEQHFNRDHYPCPDSECLEKKFVVFDSELDLQAHQLEQHPNGLSRKDARRVDMSSFDYRQHYQEPRRGGASNRRGGRGRDPNAESAPASMSGHMTRAELAHQRAREIQSAQNVTSRTFGGQLSQPEPPAQTVDRPAPSPRPANVQPAFPALGATAPTSPRPAEALTPQEQSRRLRHAAVTERASNLLRNDQTKLTEFRERISSYRTGTLSAADLIDAFFSLFDTSSAELGKLVKELADIFEVPGKRDALLKAWSDWKAINEDYPTLPGPSGSGSSTAASVLGAGAGTSRVLKLKSSTAQSSRSVGAGGVATKTWSKATGGTSSAPSASSMSFPSLPSGRANGAGSTGSNWLALRPAAASSNTSSARVSPAPSRNQSSAQLSSGSAFPALPPAKKPTSTVFSPGYTGAGVIRQNSSNAVNAWTSSGNTSAADIPSETDAGGRKGKKGKKQVVFQWG